MHSLRLLLRSRWCLVLLLLAAALAPRWAIPQGYMVDASETLTVSICSPTGHSAKTVEIPIGKQDKKTGDTAPCSFGTLSQGMLGGADPVLLATALAFLIALGFAPCHAALLSQPAGLRPPSRGPPRTA
ncbi:DUF2946 family protein [Altererythrobacter sp. Root672]|uniref:DUF2946 family protein n=1 Tax=Altererythrobacter sp. Root672 TaxID=1736584 RepID=UPI0006F9C7D1|nr:DUF2946 family protein [Altererythrobacter sp. Root672]KRA82707.1 hypothetical protein ASD76_01015 [Altererythrobacter sp. Root672]